MGSRHAVFCFTVLTALCAAPAAPVAAEAARSAADKPEVDTEELIRRLNSNDFETREQATVALGERAERIWGRLKKLAKNSEPEVRLRAKTAMAVPTQRRLATLLEETTKELQAAEKALKDEEAKCWKAELEGKAAEDKLDAANDALADGPKADAETKAKTLREAKEAVFARVRAAKEALDEQKRAYRLNNSRLLSRSDQIKQALADGETFEPGTLKDWSPSLLPFAQRMKCKVTFEFVDMPLDKAVGCIGEWAGLKVTVDAAAIAGGAASINLRVADMCADLSLEWICKLADLEYRVDQEAQTIVVRKPR